MSATRARSPLRRVGVCLLALTIVAAACSNESTGDPSERPPATSDPFATPPGFAPSDFYTLGSGRATPPDGAFVDIVATEYFTCGVRDSGTLECWGTNQPKGIPEGQFLQVDASSPRSEASHACALRIDNAVLCWGNNEFGQADAPSGKFAYVSAAGLSSCGIKLDGSVTCWGKGHDDVEPAEGAFVEVLAGTPACGLRRDGRLECWGDIWSATLAPEPLDSFAEVAVGARTACALNDSGDLHCWSIWGPGPIAGRSPQVPLTLPDLNLATITVGQKRGDRSRRSVHGDQVCGILDSGAIRCWQVSEFQPIDESDRAYANSLFAFKGPADGPYIAVAIGETGECAVDTQFRLRCWGGRFADVASADEYQDVAVSGSHVCGLRRDGTLHCWSWDQDRYVAPPSGKFTQITAGDGHFCALATSQRVRCWIDESYRLPQRVPTPLGEFVQISSAGSTACGLRSDGTATCWSGDADSRYGSPTDIVVSQKPSEEFASVAAGAGISPACGIKSNGQIDCWGYDGVGEPREPVRAFSNVAMGGTYACGLQANQQIACWHSLTGELLDSPAGTYLQVSLTESQLCAVRTDGQVLCWWLPGMALDGPLPESLTQVVVHGGGACGIGFDGEVLCWRAGTDDVLQAVFTDLAMSNWAACGVLAQGTLQCWSGDGASTRLPDGEFVDVDVTEGDRVGMGHGCAVRVDGTAACWGDNRFGQLDAPLGNFVQVSVAANSSCALGAEGSVTCWGDNRFGQADVPEGTYSKVFAGVPSCAINTTGRLECWGDHGNNLLRPPAGSYRGLAAGFGYACALSGDATLVCWGAFAPQEERGGAPEGEFSKVSVGEPRSWENFRACALRVDGALLCWDRRGWPTTYRGPYVDISMGYAHGCALRSSGTMECWLFTEERQPVLHEPPAGSFARVAAGIQFTCGVQTDTAVACSPIYANSDEVVPLDPEWRGFVEISAGKSHACAIRDDGTIECWGDNSLGQAQAPSGQYRQVIAYWATSCAIRLDGTPHCWGAELGLTPPQGAFAEFSTRNCGVRPAGQIECWAYEPRGHPASVSTLTDVAFSGRYACGIQADSAVACWYRDVDASLASPVGTYAQVSVGADLACALDFDGVARCWDLIDGHSIGPPPGAFSQVAAGHRHACATRRDDGTVICWGADEDVEEIDYMPVAE